MIIIYSYLAISLTIWDLTVIDGMKQLDKRCFKPLHMSMLNLILMTLFYMFVLTPYLTTALMLPYAAYHFFKRANSRREKKLMKHYLVKAMPSVVFSKRLFE